MRNKKTLQGWLIMSGITAALAILKFTGVISCGWLWVLSPIWLPFFIAISVAVILTVAFFIIRIAQDARNGGNNEKT